MWMRALEGAAITAIAAVSLGAGIAAATDGIQDHTAPETTIVKHPRKVDGSRVVRFVYKSNEGKARFVCRLDRRPWKDCGGGNRAGRDAKRVRVGRGRHVFKVYAIDVAKNSDSSPARFRWRRPG